MKRRISLSFIELIAWLENHRFLDADKADEYLRAAGVIIPSTWEMMTNENSD